MREKPPYSWRRVLAAIGIVVIGSILVGGLTSPAQQFLPVWFNSLANSAGGWSMFAFLLVWLSRSRPVLGGILGAVSFVLMVECYDAISAARGFAVPGPFADPWIPIGLVAGPIIGVAAALTRYGSRPWVIGSVGVLGLVLVAEGARSLVVVGATTSPVYWALEIAAGVAFVVVAIIRTRARPLIHSAESSQPTHG